MMPMVDGFATLEQIKKRTFATLQSHFLSAKIRRKILKKGLSLGANLYVTKPFSIKISGTSTGINSIIKLLLL
jgi:DNA-binding response OmpR family regulator